MAKNATNITNYYGDGSREDGRASGSRADYLMEYKYTKRLLDKYIGQSDDVLELGCGTGYYGLYLADNTYDVVMAFGPMYHLCPEDRALAFEECKRLCKPGGTILCAYICKIGLYVQACISSPDKYPCEEENKALLREGIDRSRDSIYWFCSPEEIEVEAQSHGMSVIDNLGVDIILTPEMYNPNSPKRKEWDEMLDFILTSRSCTGFANHAVMVCENGE